MIDEVEDFIERHADDTKKMMDVEDVFEKNPMFKKAYAKFAEPIILDVLKQCAKLNDK
jgi:hypothetical protein